MDIESDYIKIIVEKSKQIGFLDAGVVDLEERDPDFEKYYFDWLQKGYHGEMAYMEKNAKQRFHPEMLVENAKSAIIVLASYNYHKPKLSSKYKISRYALGADYHYVVKQKLNDLLAYIQTNFPGIQGRAFVDSAPVPERYLASKAGLGFLGKNGMLIHPEFGSFVFIGALYLDKGLVDPNRGTLDKLSEHSKNYTQCADCDLCMRACPNNAIVEPGLVDSNKCISYKTIEYKGEFTDNERLAGYIFGCDICQQVCPYNKDATISSILEFNPRKEVTQLTDDDWQAMGSSQFKRIFGQTVLFRTGLKRLRRNMALKNR